jgi:hypothetical protein
MSDESLINAHPTPARWEIGLGWTLASGAAFLVATLLARFLFSILLVFDLAGLASRETKLAETVTTSLALNLSMIGVLVGVAQWIVLRRHIKRASIWILATIVGTISSVIAVSAIIIPMDGTAVSKVFVDGPSVALANMVTFGIFGGLTGFAQWLVLRQYFRQADWWLLASFLGWLVGGATSLAFTVGIVAGATTGTALVQMIRRTVLAKPDS